MKPTQLLLYCTVTIVVLAVVVSNAKPAVADAANVNSAVVAVDGEATPATHDAYTLEATLHAPSGGEHEVGVQQAVRTTAPFPHSPQTKALLTAVFVVAQVQDLCNEHCLPSSACEYLLQQVQLELTNSSAYDMTVLHRSSPSTLLVHTPALWHVRQRVQVVDNMVHRLLPTLRGVRHQSPAR